MSKRANPYEASRQKAIKRRRISQSRRVALGLPMRTFPSRVPYATRGYRPNREEKKVNDINTANYAVNTTGVFTLLALPITGADMNQRIGRKIMLRSVYIRGFIGTEPALAASVAAAAPAQQARMIILCDMQPNGAAPAVTDLLVTAASSSHLNLSNRDRFKIYSDKTFVFDPYITSATQSVASRQIYNIKKYKKLNIETIFNATNGGSIADINTGALYMFWIGANAAGVLDATATVSTRVRYTDR